MLSNWSSWGWFIGFWNLIGWCFKKNKSTFDFRIIINNYRIWCYQCFFSLVRIIIVRTRIKRIINLRRDSWKENEGRDCSSELRWYWAASSSTIYDARIISVRCGRDSITSGNLFNLYFTCRFWWRSWQLKASRIKR